MKNNQGQAAMEFLMTYGWAILVVIAAIAALSYFGVLNTNQFTSHKCILETSGIACVDSKVNEDSVSLILRNGRSDPININTISVSGCSGSVSGLIRDGDKELFVIDGCSNIVKEKFNGDIQYTYTGQTGMSHTKTGKIIEKVEAGITSPPVDDWYDSAWFYRKAITIDNTKVITDLTNFPVLISFTDTNLRDNSTEDDILFTAVDGQTQLDHEIESYDNTTGSLIAWVKIPSLSSSVDTTIYIYYGNPLAANQESVENVWENNFNLVQHLEEASIDGTADEVTDSTSNNNDGQGLPIGATADANTPAKIGTGYFFDGNGFSGSKYVDFGNSASVDLVDQFTFSSWVRHTAGTFGTIGCKRNDPAIQWHFYTWQSGGAQQSMRVGGSWDNPIYLPEDTFVYTVFTVNGTNFKFFNDGTESASFDLELMSSTGVPFTIAACPNGYYLNGIMDEVRLSSIIRSDGWIETEYNNQDNPGSFYGVGIEESE